MQRTAAAEIAFRLQIKRNAIVTAKAWSTHPQLLTTLRERFPPIPAQLQLLKIKGEEDETPTEELNFNERAQTTATDKAPVQPSYDRIQTVLAVHGWLDNAASWDMLAPALMQLQSERSPRAAMVLVGVDISGHGELYEVLTISHDNPSPMEDCQRIMPGELVVIRRTVM